MSENLYYLGFAAFHGIGPKRFEKLLFQFGSAEKAWHAQESEISAVLKDAVGQQFINFRKEFDIASYAKNLEEKKIYFLTILDATYPMLLKQIPDKPYVIFVKGNVELLQSPLSIGIVGTRKVTDYGREVTEMFTRDLVEQQYVIVSGMAFGVDAIAHRVALKNHGRTIAVLGSGVDYPTPREHESLYQEILAHSGAVVSTFRPGERALVGSFPARNATIAGLSRGVLVTEGAEDSGALITAHDAIRFGRPVFAVPGQITSSLSKGTNNLIKGGATPVSSVYDIMQHLGQNVQSNRDESRGVKNTKVRYSANKEEQVMLQLLENEALLFDDIVRKIGKDSKEVGSILSLLELKGLVRSRSDGKYSLSS